MLNYDTMSRSRGILNKFLLLEQLFYFFIILCYYNNQREVKLMKYKINQLAKILGITTNTIRRYEKNNYIAPIRDESDYRWYDENDILKIAFIRLYRKCGFTHEQIEKMLNTDYENVQSIYQAKLNEIDLQIEALKHLRHWLKDNLQLMDTLTGIDDGFIFMDCPPLKYVIYSYKDKLFTEKDRLTTINNFMYVIHEVQLINIFSTEDINKGVFFPQRGWTIKDMDIKRLGLENIITTDNPYIQSYPTKKCMYGKISYLTARLDDNEYMHQTRVQFFTRAKNYILKNNLAIDGDVMSIVVNILGNTTDMLVCIPVKEDK